MRCPTCEQVNPEASRFCNTCGAPLTHTPSLLTKSAHDDEEIVFVLRPSLIFVVFRYAAAILLTTAAIGIYWYVYGGYIENFNPAPLPWWSVIIIAALAFLPAIYRHILRQREVYTLTNHKIEFTYGLISKLRRNIPLRNVQDVTVTQSVMERLLSIGDIVIDSAAHEGKIPLRNIQSPGTYADMILLQIQRHQR